VGGDYYAVATDTADRLRIAIGDVSGKGIPASLLMATARAVWQSIASGGPTDQGVVLEILNRSTFNDFSLSESFLTFISALYDASSSVLHYANAGHNPPIYLAAGARDCEELEVTGPIIGFERGMHFREDCREMAPGDIVVFYTDGIVEARGAKGLYGQERLARQLIALRDRSADAITEGIVRSVMEFADRQPLADDLTLIVLKRA